MVDNYFGCVELKPTVCFCRWIITGTGNFYTTPALSDKFTDQQQAYQNACRNGCGDKLKDSSKTRLRTFPKWLCITRKSLTYLWLLNKDSWLYRCRTPAVDNVSLKWGSHWLLQVVSLAVIYFVLYEVRRHTIHLPCIRVFTAIVFPPGCEETSLYEACGGSDEL